MEPRCISNDKRFSIVLTPGFPGLCSCCPVKPPSFASSLTTPLSSLASPSTPPAQPLASPSTSSAPSFASSSSDPRSSSVAELRRKAQEHSAAVLQSLQAASLHSLHQSLHSSTALNIENLLKADVTQDREGSS